MDKHFFLAKLRKKLSDLPEGEVLERLNFYSEMIDDKMEEGLTEEEAVESIGTIQEIVAQIKRESLDANALDKIKEKKRLKPLEILLLILGSPIWLSLILAVLLIAISLYTSIWCLILCVWALFASFAACSFGATVSGFIFIFSGHVWSGIASIGAGFVLVGLAIFTYFASLYATKAVVLLSKKSIQLFKKILKKEGLK